jgi:hypothetical protein
MFKTATGFLLFLPIAPSLELLLLHNAVQKNLNYATRPTHFYDVGKWIPHWTFAAGLPADTSVSLAHRLIPQELFLQQVRPDRVELTYAKNIIEDPVEIIWSTSVSSATNDAARDS